MNFASVASGLSQYENFLIIASLYYYYYANRHTYLHTYIPTRNMYADRHMNANLCRKTRGKKREAVRQRFDPVCFQLHFRNHTIAAAAAKLLNTYLFLSRISFICVDFNA